MSISKGIFDAYKFNVGDGMTGANARLDKREIDIESVDEHPGNREVRAEKVEQLAESIERDGLGQLPLVRKVGAGRWQMIAGHHRLRAYRLLYDKTGDERWSRIPVNVLSNCSDTEAERLMWATNIHNAELSAEERGRGYEVLGDDINAHRAEHPEWAGKRTNEIIAEQISREGAKVSPATVQRAKRAYRRRNERVDPDSVPTEAERAISALESAARKIARATGKGETIPIDLALPVLKEIASAVGATVVVDN